MVLQPKSDPNPESPLAQRSLEAVERAIAELRRGGTVVVTADEGDAVIARADAALYSAKRQGRNRVASDGDAVPA